MARKKHRKRARREKSAVSVHDRPTLNPSAEDIYFAEPTPTDFTLVEETSELTKRALASAAATRASRSRFLPMVKIVVTACTVLIFAGGIRSAVARSHRDESWAKKSSTTANHSAATSPPMPVNLARSEIATATPETAPLAFDAVASREKTNESQAKLEHGAVKASIDLGEEAVKLDPTSARAWLVLGAAYQQRGDIKNAWRCYHACVDRGTEGKDRAECASML
jgi:cytochrome c-type biogenesis protein CcmH/NrfG